MKIVHTSTFHPVGQGLFHSAKVSVGSCTAHYVYDCGVWPLSTAFTKSVREYARDCGSDGIETVFLSHMHWDHVSGINDLLGNAQRIGTVILPYLYPSERALVLASSFDDGPLPDPSDGGDWFVRFLTSPSRFLREDLKASRVVFVRGRDDEGVRTMEGHRPSQSLEQPMHLRTLLDLHHLPDAELQRIKEIEREVHGDVDDGGSMDVATTQVAMTQGAIRLGHVEFLLFNSKPDVDRLSSFFLEFEKIRDGRPLVAVLRSRNVFDSIREAYRRCFGVQRQNETSLAIRAMAEADDYSLGLPCQLRHVYDPTYSGERASQPFHHGSILTGDLPVNRVWNAFATKFGLPSSRGVKQEWHFVYQVPHHGAESYWSAEQARLPAKRFVVSAGRNNRYGHPHREVLADLTPCESCTGCLAWVDERRSLDYTYSRTIDSKPVEHV
jgi:hypothetical protein